MGEARKLIAADLFCGAGGFTTGAHQSGRVQVALAVNHWRTAVFSHQDNHPETRHICARIDDIDPRHDKTLPDLNLIMASPECTHHSIARGGRPIDDQKRATPWHVCVWAEAKRPQWLLIENVREFRDWGPLDEHCRPIKARKGEIFRQWIRSIEAIGYQVDHQILNAADYGAPTRRNRLFICARRGHLKRDIPWPEPTHAGRWRAAAEVIDWGRPCPSIFTRKRPLADNTIKRIEAGLKKFVAPFVVALRNNQDGHSLNAPLSTICTSGAHHALCVPFQFKAMGRCPGLTKGVDEPVSTIVASRENHAIVCPFVLPREGIHRGNTAKSPADPLHTIVAGRDSGHVVMPFLTQYHNGPDGDRRNYEPGAPLPTLDTQNRYGVVSPYLLAVNHGGDDDRSRSVADPLATLTTKTGHSLVLPFLTKYYGTGGCQSVAEPLDTVTARDRFGLAMVSLIDTCRELGVVDIGFRMLEVDELAAAQGFPAGYSLRGTKAEQVRQVGNAVCPPVAEALCRTIWEAA